MGCNFYGCSQTRPATDSTVAGINQSNTDNFKFVNFIPGNFTNCRVDVLGNIYVITAGNQLKKLNALGDSLSVYNNVKKYGPLSHIDVSNPLKILLYYKNFSTAVLLNRQLTFLSSINLRNLGMFSVSTVATSYDNNIWLFDAQDFKLKKINEAGKELMETVDWRSLFEEVPLPEKIIDQDDFVYLYDAKKGFYIFDYYGTLKNNLPFFNWEQVSVFKKTLYGFKDNQLITYQIGTLQTNTYHMPKNMQDFISIQIINNKMYVLKEAGLYIYQIL